MKPSEMTGQELLDELIDFEMRGGGNCYIKEYEQELLCRLKAGEIAMSENVRFHALRFETGKMVAEEIKKTEAVLEMLKREISVKDDLMCCGNCEKRFRYDCPLPSRDEDEGKHNYKFNNNPQHYCDRWGSDAMRRQERRW